MKIYLSVDIEGITGICHWDETEKNKPDYQYFVNQMNKEVKAVCEGVIKGGATEIWIKDAHGSGRNLILDPLPENTYLIREWSLHPYFMMQEIDDTFSAAMLIGYHSSCGTNTNPLAHSMSLKIHSMKINGEYGSEFLLNSWIASYHQVPVVLISGDQGICNQAQQLIPEIQTVAAEEGKGRSVIQQHPVKTLKSLQKKAEQALKSDLKKCLLKLPSSFSIEIEYKNHADAYRASFYQGVKQLNANTIVFEATDYFEILRMMLFVL
ncbi:MAG: M55 family metallopeptidase [Spirochaetes bacterium]|nr:M55 family metallopeptidase [Spirochaetota bacterium]